MRRHTTSASGGPAGGSARRARLGCALAVMRVVAVVEVAAVAAVALAAPATEAAARVPVRWVALGDSYTAGAVRAAGDPVAERPRSGCERTTLSYPYVIARRFGEAVRLANVSCAGATVAHLARLAQVPRGRPFPPHVHDPDAPFAPVPPQLDAVAPDTEVVTVGAGLADLDVGGLLRACARLGAAAGGAGTPCRARYAAGMDARLAEVAGQYRDLVDRLHARAPGAAVVTVGYPEVVPEDVRRCRYGSLFGFGTVTHGDLAWLRTGVLERLNTVIARVSASTGATHVDLAASTRGHGACAQPATQAWVEAVVDDGLGVAMVHPNARGHAHAAERVGEAVESVSNL